MSVMSAGMYADILPVYDMRQRIHVGPQRDHRTGFLAFENGNDACPADTCCHGKTGRLDFFRQPCRGFHFRKTHFRHCMQRIISFLNSCFFVIHRSKPPPQLTQFMRKSA